MKFVGTCLAKELNKVLSDPTSRSLDDPFESRSITFMDTDNDSNLVEICRSILFFVNKLICDQDQINKFTFFFRERHSVRLFG